jgi:hypothetical protein
LVLNPEPIFFLPSSMSPTVDLEQESHPFSDARGDSSLPVSNGL